MRRVFFITMVLAFCKLGYSQSKLLEMVSIPDSAEIFPELINSQIAGAPLLSAPVLIRGETTPIISEGMGWAAPAAYDWNQDGKKDLLIGEFASGIEAGQNLGNFIRVYLNEGTDAHPKLYNEFKYASPVFGEGDGTPLSIFTWCCLEFRPQFADLDSDGFLDLIAGQYSPGDVVWFRGSKRGFLHGQKLIQEGDSKAKRRDLPETDLNSAKYWTYSSVTFGDFDDDSDLDMIVGGAALRLSRNTGSLTQPKFGMRELLVDTAGQPLVVCQPINEAVVDSESSNAGPYITGTYDAVPLAVDWDNDGILDLLVTTGHYMKNHKSVIFFKGIKYKSRHCFAKGVPLFFGKDNDKCFPGSWIRVSVTDWNNDGINDLLVGTSVVTIEGKFNHRLSYLWEGEIGILKKNPGLLFFSDKAERLLAGLRKNQGRIEENKWKATKDLIIKNMYGKIEYKTVVHHGYVYLMLGKLRGS